MATVRIDENDNNNKNDNTNRDYTFSKTIIIAIKSIIILTGIKLTLLILIRQQGS